MMMVNLAEVGRMMQGEYSPDCAGLSLQLSVLAYTMEVDPWRAAGWQDVSYHVNHRLLTGEAANGGDGGRFSGLFSEYRQYRARFAAKSANIINQVLGTVRQREKSDSCKAVVMAKPVGEGRYLIAIGFMGTGKHLYDWIANFRIANEEGMHQGYLQLARHFEERMGEIVFEQTASEMGFPTLTLQDIIEECRRSNSRFRLWLSGHSQGGGIMQVFAYRAMLRGVLPENIIGYGFASPSVIYGQVRPIPGMQLYHLLNRDDLVPRVGAQWHIGQCLVYQPDGDMRLICYGDMSRNRDFRSVLSLLLHVRNTWDGLVLLDAIISALAALDDEETMGALSALLEKWLPDKVTDMVGDRVDDGMMFIRRFIEKQYQENRDVPVPTERVKHLSLRIVDMMRRMGTRTFVKWLFRGLGVPHRLRSGEDNGNLVPAYAYIAGLNREHFTQVLSLQHPIAQRQERKKLQSNRRKVYGRHGRRTQW